jgi:16S rRNA (adenine1518-N6/adenine1519-N6)-dimethyltransferase
MSDRPHARRPARKRFGQHFLEPAWAVKVVRAIEPAPDDVFLEVGPGRGAITGPLAAAAQHVVAFEIDRDLASSLRDARLSNVRVVEGDFLDVTAERVGREVAALGQPPGRLRVVGNLPYNVASPILFKLVQLFAGGVPVADATVMLQREVANRLLASPGIKDYGVLTILIGRHARVDRLLQLPAGAFRPAPKVLSTLVRLRFHAPDPEVRDEGIFEALVQAIFTRRRKTLANALLAYRGPLRELSPIDALDRAGIDPQRRPETLTIAELARLAQVLS